MIWINQRPREELSTSFAAASSLVPLRSGGWICSHGIGVTRPGSCLRGCQRDFGTRHWCQGGECHCRLFLHQLTCSISFPHTSGGKDGISARRLFASEGMKASKTTIPLPNCFWSVPLPPAAAPGPSCREPASWSSWEHIPLPCTRPGGKLGLLQASAWHKGCASLR